MTTPEFSTYTAAAYAANVTTPTVAYPGLCPSFPSITGLGFYPSIHRDFYPPLRARFDGLGYAVRSFILQAHVFLY